MDDLIGLYRACIENIDRVQGKIYNAGGGAENVLSLLELLDLLSEFNGRRIEVKKSDWRPGDQKVFVADVSRIADDLGWTPRTRPAEGVRLLHEWAKTNEATLRSVLGDL